LQPHATRPTPGSADLCFITATPIEETLEALKKQGVAIEEGIVERTGARHTLRSVYVRDPDGNLIEIANEIP
jgi:catechol 2,3-dioxygenase-like lactoylglutathione lyase family enzyme